MEITTRRNFFRYMALLGLATFSAAPLSAKGAKAQFLYQENPKDGEKCSLCMHFIPETNKCKIIKGSISPNGWCNTFYKIPEKK